MQLVFSIPGRPRGRGKLERFFRTVDESFLQTMSGYRNKKSESALTLQRLTEYFHEWLVEVYLKSEHSEISTGPQIRWEQNGFLPNMAESLEQLDLLLLTVPKPRKVHQDGIHFECLRYLDPTLASFVGESVIIRYDPRDLGEIRVFYEGKFLCRAICTDLESTSTSLKEIIRARNQRRRDLRNTIIERREVVAHYISAHAAPSITPVTPAPQAVESKIKLKRYLND